MAIVRDRRDRYSEDAREEAEFRRRAEKSGRTLGQQIAYEEDCADRINAQARAVSAKAYRERRAMWGGASFFDRTDRWPTRGSHFEGDPASAEWSG